MFVLDVIDGASLDTELPSNVAVPNCIGCFLMGFVNHYNLFLKKNLTLTHQAVTIGM